MCGGGKGRAYGRAYHRHPAALRRCVGRRPPRENQMHAARHSSTARGSSRRRTVLLAGSVVAVAATTAVLLAGRGVATTDAAPRCAPGEGPLLVRAAPE